MATNVAATAGSAAAAESGFLCPGRTQNTAEMLADNGPTENAGKCPKWRLK
ncbi:MAG: hypothetical protein ISS71_06025 [Phycisphaerae bacterium]|nr:hypothetical protein [Phycisphaerae bacterium]